MMVSQVILSDCDMTCHLMKALTLLLDAVFFSASSYPTISEGPKYSIFLNWSHQCLM